MAAGANSKPRMRFALFTSYCPSGPPLTMWDHPANRAFNYLDVTAWTEIARKLEAAKVDLIFWADHTAIHDVYRGLGDRYGRDSAIREAVQFPILDPSYLVPAMSAVTSNLGFVFSSNVIANHPYVFARKLTTLDHITNGRVGWNIVTSFQHSAWQNTGHSAVGEHADRYLLAEQYVEVLYRLLEGSWEDDAVVRDYAARVYADPRKVHQIDPAEGPFDHVIGPHVSEPSAQRVPLLFQAGSSSDGRAFSAKHAEGIFQAARDPKSARIFSEDMHQRMAANGRETDDAHIWAPFWVVFGSTEEEAQRKDRELAEYLPEESYKTFFSSILNVDLGAIDVDKPMGQFETNALQGRFKQLVESAPNKQLTFRDYCMSTYNQRFVGTGEQFADHLEDWRDAGVLGVNLQLLTGIADLSIFTDDVAPTLQRRGLMQSQYGPGPTLREKLFDGECGPRLPDRHPAAQPGSTDRLAG